MQVRKAFTSERQTVVAFLLGLVLLPALQYGAVRSGAGTLALLLLIAHLVLVAAFTQFLQRRFRQPLVRLLHRLTALNDQPAPAPGQPVLPHLDAQITLLAERRAEAIRLIGLIREGKGEDGARPAGSQTDGEPLVAALLGLNATLQTLAEKEKQRLWMGEGLARFVEILRGNHDDHEKLYDTILTTLVRYVKANQGVLVVRREEDGTIYLEQVSCYAYERKKYTSGRFEVGQGLLGQCYLEAETIFLREIPAGHVRITSGLGEATPTCLLLVPLKLNDEVLGVVELATFHPFQPFEVELVEKLAENIAATLAGIHSQQTTGRLLSASQEQAQQLALQESALRQNMEEMQATQEEMLRSQKQLQQQEEVHRQKVEELIAVREELEAQLTGQLAEAGRQKSRMDAFLKSSLDVICFLDGQGRFVQVSPAIEKMFGYKPGELTGKPVETILPLKDGKFIDAYASGCGKEFGIPVEFTAKSKMYGFLFPVEVSVGKAEVEGEMLHTVTIRNITKRKEYEENTRKSLRNLQELNDTLQRKEQELKQLKAQLSDK
jgi:PAS domain S-box-containing protein